MTENETIEETPTNPPSPPEEDTTESVLDGMLKENTGRAMCDSGGTPSYDAQGNYTGSSHGYGRRFERNAGRDFERETSSTLSGKCGIEAYHNTYHWLKEKTEFHPQLDTLFTRYVEWHAENDDTTWNGRRRSDWPWLAEAADFVEGTNLRDWLKKQPGLVEELDLEEMLRCLDNNGGEMAGIYGDGSPFVTYTYNYDNMLSTDIQFTYFEIPGMHEEGYLLLQTHNGCDARGGMTRARGFQCSEELSVFDYSKGYIAPKPYTKEEKAEMGQQGDLFIADKELTIEGTRWYTDDGYTWYTDDFRGTKLNDYEIVQEDEWEDEWEDKWHLIWDVWDRAWEEGPPPLERGKGVICVDEDGSCYCPLTGRLLQLWF